MELHINITGWLFILLASIHLFFPRYFNWRKECCNMSLINRQMMYVHTLFIAVAILLAGILCITSSEELVNTVLGRRISLGFGIFWALRLLVQFFGYSHSLWIGKRFETVIHIIFSFLWAYFSLVFFIVYFQPY